MHYVQRMQVLHRPSRLREEEGCFRLREEVLGVLVEKQIPLLGVLEDLVDVAVFSEGVPEGDDVGVLDRGVQFYFSFDQFKICFGRD